VIRFGALLAGKLNFGALIAGGLGFGALITDLVGADLMGGIVMDPGALRARPLGNGLFGACMVDGRVIDAGLLTAGLLIAGLLIAGLLGAGLLLGRETNTGVLGSGPLATGSRSAAGSPMGAGARRAAAPLSEGLLSGMAGGKAIASGVVASSGAL
jgi:hypothetical protein